jgi:steroid delta-isomerase
MTRQEMERHAAEWVAAWNRRDIEAVLAAFREDSRFVSPKATQLTGDALVSGKDALRSYWREAAKHRGAVAFRLDRVVCDPAKREMVLIYDRLDGEKRSRACEIMRFDEAGRQIEGEAMVGAELRGEEKDRPT